jgi:hypothetical protein
MNIQDAIFSLPKEQVISKLENMLRDPELSISFFGGRRVKVNGYEGTCCLDMLAKKMRAAAMECKSLEERAAAFKVWTNVQLLYEKIEELENERCCTFRVASLFQKTRDYFDSDLASILDTDPCRSDKIGL